jgi:hypothetical protein
VKNDVKFQTQGKVFFETYTLSLTRSRFRRLKVLGSNASLDHSMVRHQLDVFLLDVHTSDECLAGSPWVRRHSLFNHHQRVPAICSKVPGSEWLIRSRAPSYIQAWVKHKEIWYESRDLDLIMRHRVKNPIINLSWEINFQRRFKGLHPQMETIDVLNYIQKYFGISWETVLEGSLISHYKQFIRNSYLESEARFGFVRFPPEWENKWSMY